MSSAQAYLQRSAQTDRRSYTTILSALLHALCSMHVMSPAKRESVPGESVVRDVEVDERRGKSEGRKNKAPVDGEFLRNIDPIA
jgi:hypothetical protein